MWGMNSSKDGEFVALIILVLSTGFMMCLNYMKVINIDRWPLEEFLIFLAVGFLVLTVIMFSPSLF
jgi:hypothetical protein